MAWKFPWELPDVPRAKGRLPGWVKLGDIQPRRAVPASGHRRKLKEPANRSALDAAEGTPCPYCTAQMTRNNIWPRPSTAHDATRDHAFPRSAGWRLDSFNGANRVVCCYQCNQDKAASDIVDWHARLHAGRDARASVVFAAILALDRAQQTGLEFPAAVRAKLNLARLRVLHIPAGSGAAMREAKDAKVAARIANHGQSSGESVAG